jgi:hypothetical protein
MNVDRTKIIIIYKNITVAILNIIHRPVLFKAQLNPIGLSVPMKHIRSLLRVQ